MEDKKMTLHLKMTREVFQNSAGDALKKITQEK